MAPGGRETAERGREALGLQACCSTLPLVLLLLLLGAGLGPGLVTLAASVVLSAVAHLGVFIALALTSTPDVSMTPSLAAAAALPPARGAAPAQPARQQSLGRQPAPLPQLQSQSALAPVALRHRAPRLAVALLLHLLCAALGTCAVLWALARPAGRQGFWGGVNTGAAYLVYYLASTHTVLAFPDLQRRADRRLKAAVPGALRVALAFALASALWWSSVAPALLLASALHVWACEMARAAFEVAFTHRNFKRQLAQHSPAPPSPLAWLAEVSTGAPHFQEYRDALAFCELAESPADVSKGERSQLFGSKERYPAALAECCQRLDAMTVRIRARLGVPLASADELRTLAPFSWAGTVGGGAGFPSLLGRDTGGLAAGAPLAQTDIAGPSAPFHDRKLLEWSARAMTALTVASAHKDARGITEDKLGWAQMSGANAAVLQSLLSALLACEELAVLGEPDSLAQKALRLLPASPGPLASLVESFSELLGPAVPRYTAGGPTGRPSDVGARPWFQKSLSVSEAAAKGVVYHEAASMAALLHSCVFRIGGAFPGEILAGPVKRAVGQWSGMPLWFGAEGSKVFGTLEDHMEKFKLVMQSS